MDEHESISIPYDSGNLLGILSIPENARGMVIFAHGTGSSRFSPRNTFVAEELNKNGCGTLLLDLLTEQEEEVDLSNRHLRFNIDFLAGRLGSSVRWIEKNERTRDMKIGLFGSSTGAAAALVAASELGSRIATVVSRGGRPDLAGDALKNVVVPTLLIVGGNDPTVLQINKQARKQMKQNAELVVVEGATHLFEEPGALMQVAQHAGTWFRHSIVLQ